MYIRVQLVYSRTKGPELRTIVAVLHFTVPVTSFNEKGPGVYSSFVRVHKRKFIFSQNNVLAAP